MRFYSNVSQNPTFKMIVKRKIFFWKKHFLSYAKFTKISFLNPSLTRFDCFRSKYKSSCHGDVISESIWDSSEVSKRPSRGRAIIAKTRRLHDARQRSRPDQQAARSFLFFDKKYEKWAFWIYFCFFRKYSAIF